MLLALDGKLHVAPIEGMAGGLHNVLDVATGTGNWAIDFGEPQIHALPDIWMSVGLTGILANAYPSVNVVGTDLTPMQPE